MKTGGVTLRRLRDAAEEYRRLAAWCRQEEVYRYFEQRVLTDEEIERKYRPRTREDAAVPVFMIEHEGRPVGVVQYQAVCADSDCRRFLPDGNGYEIDIFIGEADERGKGIGRQAVELMAEVLFEEKGADALVMCPLRENVRAVRCYRKCGFEERGVFEAADTVGVRQEYVCMVRTKFA